MASPKQCNFTRATEVGDAEMYSKDSETGEIWSLFVEHTSFKGASSDFASLKGSNEKNQNTPNIYHSEYVKNRPGDILSIVFEGHITRNVFTPDIPDKQSKDEILAFLDACMDKGAFSVIAQKILTNILNYRWLRRNAETFQYQRVITFQTANFTHSFKLPDWEELPTLEQAETSSQSAVQECIKFIEHALCHKKVDRWFKVTADLYTGKNLTIFPSQLLITKEPKNSSSQTSQRGRTFLKGIDRKTGRPTPLIKETHILYALFTFDVWYDKESDLSPINVNASGFVEHGLTHYRDHNKQNSVFDYQRKIDKLTGKLNKVSSPSDISGETLYLLAMYLHGGLFGENNE